MEMAFLERLVQYQINLLRKIYSIFLILLFISCNQPKQEIKELIVVDEILIPRIEKNKSDINFKLKNGILFYSDEPYSGIVNEFYKDANLKSKSTYYEGKREGEYFGFYADQKKRFERYYCNGLKVKTHKGWFLNGQQMFEYQFNNIGVYDGYVKEWHLNGQIAKHFNFVDGKESGSQKMWKFNGEIRSNFYTVNGDRHGLIGLKKCVSVPANK